jgi:lipid-binding SYLF domain-containing protein
VFCTLNLAATSALADGSPQSCGYDFQRTQMLKEKGDQRAARAQEIIGDMLKHAQSACISEYGAEECGAQPGSPEAVAAQADSKAHGYDKVKKSAKNIDAMMPLGLPKMLKDPSRCLVVIPSEKTVDFLVPFFTGLSYGRGVEFCDKNADGSPDVSKPTSYVQLEGVDMGAKFGIAESTDLVLSVSKDDVNNRKINVSADASAAFIDGRDVSVGLQSDGKSSKPAVAVAYSKSKGFLAAATIDVSNISPDKDMIDAESGKVSPERNPFMRLLHMGARKKADLACVQRDAVVADAQAAPAENLESASMEAIVPQQSLESAPAAAMASASVESSKSVADSTVAAAPAAASLSLGQSGSALGGDLPSIKLTDY